MRSKKAKSTFTRREFVRWSTAGALGSLIPFGYANRSTNWLSVEEIEVRIPNWDADGFRAVVLADLHMTSPTHLQNAMVAANAAIEQKADVVLVPGDFVNSSGLRERQYIKSFCDRLGEGKAPVFATMGNHDYSVVNVAAIIRRIRGTKVRLLQNEVQDLDGVSIAGIDDALFGKQKPEVLVPGQHSRSLLAMLHEPDFVREMPDHVSLQVSGHSHGGQICLPFGVPIHLPFGAEKYVDGFYPEAKVPLFVTRGIGTTGIPYRMFCRPQIAVLTIKQV